MANNSKVEGLTVLGEDHRGTRYDLGGGWVRTLRQDGTVVDGYDCAHAKRTSQEFEREERQAWDLYAASQLRERPVAVEAAQIADLMIRERRKRFGGVR